MSPLHQQVSIVAYLVYHWVRSLLTSHPAAYLHNTLGTMKTHQQRGSLQISSSLISQCPVINVCCFFSVRVIHANHTEQLRVITTTCVVWGAPWGLPISKFSILRDFSPLVSSVLSPCTSNSHSTLSLSVSFRLNYCVALVGLNLLGSRDLPASGFWVARIADTYHCTWLSNLINLF